MKTRDESISLAAFEKLNERHADLLVRNRELRAEAEQLREELSWLWGHVPFWSAISLRSHIERVLPDARDRYLRRLDRTGKKR